MLGNKGGITVKAMVIYSCIIFAFFFLAIFLIYTLSSEFKKVPPNNDSSTINNPQNNTNPPKDNDRPPAQYNYIELENKEKRASLEYVDANYPSGFGYDSITVNVNNLINYEVLDSLKDPRDNSDCIGYAIIRVIDNKNSSEVYIKCNNYTTAGFQDWRLVN